MTLLSLPHLLREEGGIPEVYMNQQYEHDQERLINATGQAISTAISVGAQLWMGRQKPIKVEVRTAAEDAQDIRTAMQRGASKQELSQTIRQGEVYQRVAKAGGDANKYERLIMQRAEIDHAVALMPSKAPAQIKTPKKKTL